MMRFQWIAFAACLAVGRAAEELAPTGSPAQAPAGAFAPGLAAAPGPASAEASGPYTLPKLPYAYDALEPSIDNETTYLHHDKHLATYITNLNTALATKEGAPSNGRSLGALIKAVNTSLPAAFDTALRNDGGGVINHVFWFASLVPPSKALGKPQGKLASKIDQDFGSFDAFKSNFTEHATKLFGSGFTWLIYNDQGKLQIINTPNQANPLMTSLALDGHGYPIIGLDVWEHAYYLKYHNVRASYIKAYWNVVNWEYAETNYERALNKTSEFDTYYGRQ